MELSSYESRRCEISKMKGNIPKDIDIILVEQLVLSTGLLVLPCSTWEFKVTHAPTGFGFTVDLEKRTCTCPEFQMLGLLCRHAIAVASSRNMDYNMFVSEYHVKQTWAETVKGIILPIPDPKDVFVPAEILKVEVYPSMTKRTKGRPCIKRKLSAGEFLGIIRYLLIMPEFPILSLPAEVQALVVQRVAHNSIANLYRLWATSKSMRALADNGGFMLRSICSNSLEYFYRLDRHVEGLALIKRAADAGFE
ncbi:hypothetical protein F2Q68_00014278 [Brassica cretica]|uniref:SWIM-type domain-containing protein n=1 Tax=Brassica cretica TaxID=69181 RepID=A0A8S9HR85_BRACR|nr:hypothetical protein F2Q68_00014278 [Brassica cretica]